MVRVKKFEISFSVMDLYSQIIFLFLIDMLGIISEIVFQLFRSYSPVPCTSMFGLLKEHFSRPKFNRHNKISGILYIYCVTACSLMFSNTVVMKLCFITSKLSKYWNI